MRTRCIGIVLFLTCAYAFAQTALPVISRLSYGSTAGADLPFYSPGGFLTLEGSGFAGKSLEALVAPYPKKLAGVSVTANGLACPIVSVSPARAVIMLPYALAAAETPDLSIILSNDAGSSDPVAAQWGFMPVLLTTSREYGTAVMLDENYAPLSQVNVGQTVVLLAMGLGPTEPPVADGVAAPASDPLPAVVRSVRVFFGDTEAQVLSAILAPGQVGLYYVKAIVPEGGDGSVAVMADDNMLDRGTVPQPAPPPNVSNVSGSIESIYGPGPLSAPGWSPIFAAAGFRVSLTVQPGARPFNIELKGPAGGVTIKVSPADGNWLSTTLVPNMQLRSGDFNGTSLTAVDFTPDPIPFAGNIVPASRIPSHYFAAWQIMPLPNALIPGGTVGFMMFGTIPTDGPLVFDYTTTPVAATGGWIPISAPAPATYTATFTLFVDGTEITRAKIDVPVMP
jgi:uncharacterized protein (TIGR03437 family)